VTLASSNIESFSKLKPTSQSDAVVTYGPYSNAEPFSFDAMTLHFENNNPFLVVSKLERAIELSMWGNIAVEESIDVRHNGAKLKGSFSRYEFQRENSGVSSVKSFKTVLPASGTFSGADFKSVYNFAKNYLDSKY
jgi:oligosaccharyltransferase complex subunit alpha (ribophorin I)